MNKLMLTTLFLLSSTVVFAQEALGMPNFLPSRKDSLIFRYYLGVSYFVPDNSSKDTVELQKSRLPVVPSRNRLVSAKMGFAFFMPFRTDKVVEPHVSFDVKVYNPDYLTSRMGVGVSYRPWNASLGFFRGEYYRRVPGEGNFVTRRSRQFDNYPLSGAYLQAANDSATFLFTVTAEKYRMIYAARISGRIGYLLRRSRDRDVRSILDLRRMIGSVEVVLSYDDLSGVGAGLMVQTWPRTTLEVLWLSPPKDLVVEKARLGQGISPGFLFTLVCRID